MQGVEGPSMRDFIRSCTEKIESFVSAFSARSDTSLEDEQKIRFFALVTFLAIPIFISFFILHLSQEPVAHPVRVLLAGAGQVVSLLALVRLKNPKVAFRISASVLGVYFLFLICVGGTHGTTMLWMLIMPAYFFFLLGKREGLVWTAAGFLASLSILSDPTGLFSTYHYERTVAARFLLTYGLIAAVAYFGESTRERYARQLLQVQTQRFQTLCTNAPFGMVIISKDGDFQYANPKFKEIFGYDLSDVPNGREWFQKAYPDRAYRHKTIAAWKEDLEGLAPGRTRSRVFEVTCKDGSRKMIHFRPVKLDTGEDLMTCEDITDRMRADEALQESEEKLRAVVYGCPIPQFVIDRDHRIICWNKVLEQVSGVKAEEVMGTKEHWRAFYTKERPCMADLLIDGEIERTADWYGEKCGKSKLLADAYEATDFFPAIGKEGKWLDFTAALIRDSKGNVMGAVETLEDITDRKRGEQALRESEEKYRTLFEESIDAVYITTREGILIDANQAFLDLFGFSREEARNMEILQIYTDAADRKRFQEEIERKGSLKDYEVSFRKKDGTKIEGLLTSTVRRDKDGKLLGYQGIIRDVTEHKQLQKQLLQAQKMEAIGTLAGGIAHDFNNLLQAILGYTDLLIMRKKMGDPDLQKLEIVRQSARDGADLVSRILTFSMKAEFRARPTDLNQEIRRVEKLLLRTVPKMIKIDLVLADDLWVIDADPAQIEQVILNLAVNAQYAMPDGGRLSIETSNVSLRDEYLRNHMDAKQGKYVLLTVSDTGMGMKPEVVDRIFEPFFTTKADGEGTGLGLAMVHGIVSQHRGYIRCYSEPSRGTCFEIYLPVSASELLSDLTLTREMPAFGTETILLVDDDDRIREMGKQMIEMGGYQVLTAGSGEEALVVYGTHRQDIALVILDLIMPGMGGKSCLQKLLLIDPDVRVLVASGYSSDGFTMDETVARARGFVRKPYDTKDILASIRQVLDREHL